MYGELLLSGKQTRLSSAVAERPMTLHVTEYFAKSLSVMDITSLSIGRV